LPEEILALTFTEKAAGEMQKRADLLLPLGYYDMWISTFHSFCERILKNHALDIGLSNDFKLLNDVQQWILIYNNFDKFDLNYYRPLGSPNRFIDALLTHFSRCKDELIAPDDYLKYAQNLRLQTDSPDRISKKKAGKKSAPASLLDPLEGEDIARIEETAGAYHVYQKLLLDNNYLDFGDLISYARELFLKRPLILNFYQKKFKYFFG
jgi:DNA helicase II / ATP-dependent DNA helicase PcrA